MDRKMLMEKHEFKIETENKSILTFLRKASEAWSMLVGRVPF